MDRPRHVSPLMEIPHPPRDGEFFFEEGGGAKPVRRERGCALGCLLGQHPYFSLAFAAGVGVFVASVLLRL